MSQAEKNGGPDGRERSCQAVVLKFGGTSVEDAAALRRVAGIVKQQAGPVLVVVSALAGVTDQLLAAGEQAGSGRLERVEESLRAMEKRHGEIAGELLGGASADAYLSYLRSECTAVSKLLQGVAAVGEFSARTADRVVGTGELLSSRLLAEILREGSSNSVWVDARQCVITDDNFGSAQPLREETDRRLQELLMPLLEAGQIPVLGGFIGATSEGTPTTLGRGGSDLSAALVARGVKARVLEIWTDVDGIMTADPRLCPDARLIADISFAEAAELAQAGAKVLHPAALLPATERNIPAYVRNSRRPHSRGTRIVPEGTRLAGVQAITAKRGVVIVEARLRRPADAHTLQQILKACEGQNLELCSFSRQRVVLLMDGKQAARQLGRALRDVAEVQGENHKAIVRVFGDRIGRRTKVVGQIFQALEGIEVRLACPGEGERNLTLVVDEDHAGESVRRLHSLFFPAASEAEEELSGACVQ